MEKSVGRLVSILYRKNQVCLNAVLKPLNITSSELPILTYLFRHDGVSQEELSAFLVIDKGSTARMVQSLMKKGFVRKEKDTVDRRANRIFLTELALKQESKIYELLRQWNSFLIEGLEEQSVNIMFTALENMVKKVDNTDFREIWRNK